MNFFNKSIREKKEREKSSKEKRSRELVMQQLDAVGNQAREMISVMAVKKA